VKKPLKILLFPLALLYGFIIHLRNWLFNLRIIKSVEFGFPVISVGNIGVGGTGKTPHTEYLVGLLTGKFIVAVLSRGYGRNTREFMFVENSSTTLSVGDEPLQIKKKYPEAIVAVDRNRVNGIRMIREAFPEVNVIILDDAFQHRYVTPGYNILLTSHDNLITRDYLIPFGRLREHRKNKKRADMILVSKSPEALSPLDRRMIVKEIIPSAHQHIYFTSVRYGDPVHLIDKEVATVTLEEIGEMETQVLLVTGIASPDPLADHLNKFTDRITHLKYPDHHPFSQDDLDQIVSVYNSLPSENKCLITTEKDSVRLMEIPNIVQLLGDRIFYIPIWIIFLNNDEVEFNNYIIDYVGKNKPDNIIS